MDARLIFDSPAAGAWNMAVDEALLQAAAEGGPPALRFYRWSEPTLSLGYFQPYAARLMHAASAGCPAVRRQTGGGAIVHDCELTYSLVLPASHPLARRPAPLYQTVHDSLIDILRARGIDAHLAAQSPANVPLDPFLCFERRAPEDVVCGAAKICGSAQRRARGAVLQHGSILLAASACAPTLGGILEAGGAAMPWDELASELSARLGARLGWRWKPIEETPPGWGLAEELRNSRYANSAWTRRR